MSYGYDNRPQSSRRQLRQPLLAIGTVIALATTATIAYALAPRVQDDSMVLVFGESGKITSVHYSGEFMPGGDSWVFRDADWSTSRFVLNDEVVVTPGAENEISSVTLQIGFEGGGAMSLGEAIEYYNERIDEGDPVDLQYQISLEQAVQNDVLMRVSDAWRAGEVPSPEVIITSQPSIKYDPFIVASYEAFLAKKQAAADAQAALEAEQAAAATEPVLSEHACEADKPCGPSGPPTEPPPPTEQSVPIEPSEEGPPYLFSCWSASADVQNWHALSSAIQKVIGASPVTFEVPASFRLELRTALPCGLEQTPEQASDETTPPPVCAEKLSRQDCWFPED